MFDRWLAGPAFVALLATGAPVGVLAQVDAAASGAAAPATAQAAGAGLAGARTGPVRVEAVEVELVSETAAIVAGQPARLGLRIRHDPHWHTYWRNPGDSGLATQLGFELPDGFRTADIQWPAPQRLFIAPLANYGYEDEIVLPVPLQVPATIGGRSVRVAARASWLMCREVCIPGEAALALELPVASGPAPASAFAALFEQADRRMPRGQVAVRAFAEGDTLSIGLPGRPAAAEFFPYREGLVHNAGEQVLHAIDGEGVGARLVIGLTADGAKQVLAGGDALAAAAEGIVILDGEPRELAVSVAAAAFPAGPEISRVAGAPQTPPQAQRGGLELPGGVGAPASSGDRAGSSMVGSLWLAAIFGALGGLILNLMPCVFPVIGLKVLGFARHGSEGSAASRIGALAFAAGVVVSFWLLAGLLLALRAAGEAAGWGFQLQSPLFVAAMALLFVAIALNFSGQYEIGLALTRLGRFDRGGAYAAQPAAGAHPVQPGGNAYAAQTGRAAHPLAGSFGAGVLAVLVATPCTAPFMGSALGYTLGSSSFEALVVFTAIGLGMAAPYLLLGMFPAWLRWLPRPGRWMETFRQALAFPMYATAAWLAWVLGQQAGIDAVFALAIGAVLLALALWLYGRFVQRGAAGARRAWVGALAAVLLALGLWTAWPARDAGDGPPLQAGDTRGTTDATAWQPWSPERVADALAQGRPVFVDFTAAWCVSCQANKRLVLERDAIVEAMAQRSVLRLKADWTNRDAAITAELARFGRNGVPLYLLYRPGEAEPQILPELLTGGIVMSALSRVALARL
jgi:thiol:disulfide interchange protein DsbD